MEYVSEHASGAVYLSVLFSEPKIPQYRRAGSVRIDRREVLSVLFSEPKIPQSKLAQIGEFSGDAFSALQRAENSSIENEFSKLVELMNFQCSSASRKFLNRPIPPAPRRAAAFQCSSASRKFLNRPADAETSASSAFSALQRAENSSITPTSRAATRDGELSVLFSEPKIPQSV